MEGRPRPDLWPNRLHTGRGRPWVAVLVHE